MAPRAFWREWREAFARFDESTKCLLRLEVSLNESATLKRPYKSIPKDSALKVRDWKGSLYFCNTPWISKSQKLQNLGVTKILYNKWWWFSDGLTKLAAWGRRTLKNQMTIKVGRTSQTISTTPNDTNLWLLMFICSLWLCSISPFKTK